MMSPDVNENQSWAKRRPSLWMLPRYPSMLEVNLSSCALWGTLSIKSRAFWRSLLSSPRQALYLTNSWNRKKGTENGDVLSLGRNSADGGFRDRLHSHVVDSLKCWADHNICDSVAISVLAVFQIVVETDF